ncbi:uncharacterized protein A4U43_C03F11100 [Asparagus officinalis]|uniref:Uncharacterized protein n=1 Tax=Asparagus officinalis TaxID=4686 RepID=A0A5P1FAW5_ASPOF|nr:uncharacterized protein A4U43_C03F11100 [Asparagus officinalis]
MEERYFEEEKVVSSKKGGDDEGLEVAKLGIDQSIVGELAMSGITKLFPIQMMMKLMQQMNANLKCHISIRALAMMKIFVKEALLGFLVS